MSNGSDLNKMLEKILGKNWLWTILGTITIIIIMYAIFYFEAHDTSREILDARTIDMMVTSGEDGGGEPGPTPEWTTETQETDGRATEGQPSKAVLTLDKAKIEKVKSITFTLTWVDEDQGPSPGPGLAWENEPDEFKLTLTSPSGETFEGSGTNAPGQMGSITVTPKISEENQEEEVLGDWEWEVLCVDAGDWQTAGPFGALISQDDGNDWHLTIDLSYATKE